MRFAVSLVALFVLGCAKPDEAPTLDAKFGVFFGGQVQEREELPLVLDRTRQSHGIRLDFREPPKQALRVTWEIAKPQASKLDDAGNIVEYGETRTRVGEQRLEIPLAFRAGDRPGAWHVRVTVAERVVLDRAFRVVPAGPPPRAAEE
ncbi:MAG TPA: hypothetical protein VF103_08890 [Polyangiaceae bacterium]